jgi:hypothetical protein
MAYGTTIVKYDGTNRGTVYLRDVGQRTGLGGGRSIYNLYHADGTTRGQDRYLAHGTDCTFLSTSDVMMSRMYGVIKNYENLGSFTVSNTVDS